MARGTPRIANSSASVSITSSLVIPRSTFQRQALPRVLIHQRQPFQRAAVRRPIKHEIPTPDVILVFRSPLMASILAASQRSPFSPFARHFQPFPTPQAIQPRIAGPPAFRPQQTADPAITEPGATNHQLTHPLRQRGFITARLRNVTLAAARLIHDRTGSTLGHFKRLLQFDHGGTLSRRAYQFPR